MSQRYRVERAEQGAINDPSPTNLNQNQFAAEFNGNMDRSNIPYKQITGTSVVAGAFTTVGADPQTSTVALDNTSTTWQNIHSVTVTVAEDSVLEVDWSGGFAVTGATTVSTGGSDGLRVAVFVNGKIVASTGPILPYICSSLPGVYNVQAGSVTITVSVMLAVFSVTIPSPGVWELLGPTSLAVTAQERELVYMLRSR